MGVLNSAQTGVSSFLKENDMTTTSPEQNKALVLKAFDALFNKRDYVAAESFWSDRYIQHSAHIPPGRNGLFDLVRGLPDTLRYENHVVQSGSHSEVPLSPLPMGVRSGSVRKLALDPRIEAHHVDYDALMNPFPDRFAFVAGLDAKSDGPALDAGNFGGRCDAQTDRGRRKVAHVKVATQALMARRQQLLNGSERCCLDQVDHYRRGKYRDPT